MDDCEVLSDRYSAALEFPVPDTVVISELVPLPMVPAVSVTEVYPPKRENTRSVSASVETPATDGAEAVELHVLPPFGRTELGSNGVVVSAPATPKAMPEAESGVVESLTVITSLVNTELAIPYHSTKLDFSVVVQKVVESLAVLCQVMLPRESDMEDTVTVVDPSFATIESTITSFAFVVLTEGIVNEVPDDQVPEALPSCVGAGGSAKSCNDRDPAGIEVEDPNWGDQRYIVELAGSVNVPAPWTMASHSIPQYVVDDPNAHDAPDWVAETILYSASIESPVPATDLIFVPVVPAIAPTV